MISPDLNNSMTPEEAMKVVKYAAERFVGNLGEHLTLQNALAVLEKFVIVPEGVHLRRGAKEVSRDAQPVEPTRG